MSWLGSKHLKVWKWEIDIYPRKWRLERLNHEHLDWQVTPYIGGFRCESPCYVYRWMIAIGPIDIWRCV